MKPQKNQVIKTTMKHATTNTDRWRKIKVQIFIEKTLVFFIVIKTAPSMKTSF
jgi:hypothetical protein